MEVRRREVTSTVRMTWRTNRVDGAIQTRMLASIIKNIVERVQSDGFSRWWLMSEALIDAQGA